MPREIPDNYGSIIKIGTKNDDRRMEPTNIYLEVGTTRLILSSTRVLRFDLHAVGGSQ